MAEITTIETKFDASDSFLSLLIKIKRIAWAGYFSCIFAMRLSRARAHDDTVNQLVNELPELVVNIFLGSTHAGSIGYNVSTTLTLLSYIFQFSDCSNSRVIWTDYFE